MEPRTVFIDGLDVPNLRLFFKTMVAELEFPSYVNNIENFKKKINDLSWLEGAKVRISISNGKHFLTEEDDQVRTTILQIMISAMEDGYAKSPVLVLISKD